MIEICEGTEVAAEEGIDSVSVKEVQHALFQKEECLNCDFFPLDDKCLSECQGSGSSRLEAAFLAFVNNQAVAKVGIFVSNSRVILGGVADADLDVTIRKALIGAAENKSRFIGASSISLYTAAFSVPAIALYKKLGFCFSGKRKLIHGTPLLHMEKSLFDVL